MLMGGPMRGKDRGEGTVSRAVGMSWQDVWYRSALNTGMKILRFGDLYFAILISAWFAFVLVDILPHLLSLLHFYLCISCLSSPHA